ncbi:hypothetical protein KFK09_010015 [Dendrobium nobile]|uniref:Peptidoglycan binding-like domain-containing protein n=1 Tax=Dendrobium nobile TaxID=94219 RepID=A0A8T3BN54_DENNO|nr:hypothetical protein KFK09_010015 [Dendrobium nobile]
MAIASLPPRPHPTLLTRHHHSPAKSTFPTSFLILRNPNRSFSSSSTTVVTFASSSSWEQEEKRWLREEQRWLREEQRWLREECRWSSEREALLREIAALRLRIDALEGERSPLADAVEAVLVAAKERRLIAGAEKIIVEEDVVKEMVHEGIRVPEEEGEKEGLKENKVVNEKKERKTLRMGSEGEDVREMQEALQRLGFYSGEDDMEYSSFSTGTDRAVKTWQASLGATENGIMTSELLERLFVELYLNDSNTKGSADERENTTPVERKDGTNGAPIASVRKFAEIQETLIKEAGDTEIGISQHRVFLLGENRWEEPSRLQGRNKPSEASKASSSTRCLTCRGEGRLMCSECDGTGEPNIEPQFLEWVDEGAKCPYCDGLGYIICDVCEGKSIVQN